MFITKRMKFMIPEVVLNDSSFINLFNELFNISNTLHNEKNDCFERLKIANELANILCYSDKSKAENVIEKYKEVCIYYINIYKKIYFKKRLEKIEKDFN